MKVLIVVNPVSGNQDKESLVDAMKSYLKERNITNEFLYTNGKDDKTQLKDSVHRFSPDRIFAVGGDGTIQLVCSVIRDTPVKLGIIPGGSANGMAADLKIPDQPFEAFTEQICSENVRSLDIIEVNNEYLCIHIGDIGINAAIVASYEQEDSRGMMTYAKYLVEHLEGAEPFKATIQIGTDLIERDIIMLAICNSRRFGTGVAINNMSNPFDERFELVLIESIEAMDYLQAGLSVIDSNLADYQGVQVVSGNEAKIRLNNRKTLQLDGEVIGDFNELGIACKNKVQLIVTPKMNYLTRG